MDRTRYLYDHFRLLSEALDRASAGSPISTRVSAMSEVVDHRANCPTRDRTGLSLGFLTILSKSILLCNNLTINLSTLNLLSTLEFEPLQASNTNIDQETAARILVDRLAIIAAGLSTACRCDEQLCADEAWAGGLAGRKPDFSNDLALWRNPQHTATVVQRSPHVTLLVNAVTVWHCVLAVLVVLGHCKEGASVCHRAGLGVEVKLVDDLVGAVGEEHGVVVLVPCCAVGDANVGEGAIERHVRVQTEDSAYVRSD